MPNCEEQGTIGFIGLPEFFGLLELFGFVGLLDCVYDGIFIG